MVSLLILQFFKKKEVNWIEFTDFKKRNPSSYTCKESLTLASKPDKTEPTHLSIFK